MELACEYPLSRASLSLSLSQRLEPYGSRSCPSRTSTRGPRYLGISTEGRAPDLEAPFRHDAVLAFEWRARGEGLEETCVVTARSNNVLERRVPLPGPWITALRCLHLPALAERGARGAREEGGEEGRRLRDARCLLLGPAPRLGCCASCGLSTPGGSPGLFGPRA